MEQFLEYIPAEWKERLWDGESLYVLGEPVRLIDGAYQKTTNAGKTEPISAERITMEIGIMSEFLEWDSSVPIRDANSQGVAWAISVDLAKHACPDLEETMKTIREKQEGVFECTGKGLSFHAWDGKKLHLEMGRAKTHGKDMAQSLDSLRLPVPSGKPLLDLSELCLPEDLFPTVPKTPALSI